jgi:hypothetical protein
VSTAPLDPWAEWKDGYRDGLMASIKVAQACAAEPDATAQDVLTLLSMLSESQVISTGHGDAVVVVSRLHPPDAERADHG